MIDDIAYSDTVPLIPIDHNTHICYNKKIDKKIRFTHKNLMKMSFESVIDLYRKMFVYKSDAYARKCDEKS